MLELTPDRLRAARACGCVLTPATEAEVRRLSMQRRVFSIDGQPFVATRGGFLETHGTLAALLEKQAPEAPERHAEAEVAPTLEVAPSFAEAAPEGVETPEPAFATPGPAEPDAVRAGRNGRQASAAKPRKARTPKPKPPSASTDMAIAAGIAAEAPEVDATAAETEAVPTTGLRARGARRRAGQPTPPRWMVAGKLRRGRPT